jgi:hypothetical protein
MLKEATVILPDNAEYDAHLLTFQHELATIFGGYTVTKGEGGWVSPRGDHVRDLVRVYTVAMADSEANADVLEEIALRYGRQLGQEAVYIRFPNGNVDIIDTAQAIAA